MFDKTVSLRTSIMSNNLGLFRKKREAYKGVKKIKIKKDGRRIKNHSGSEKTEAIPVSLIRDN